MNKILSVASALGGIFVTGYGVASTNLATGFTGLTSITVAVLLFQMADVRERTARIESLLMSEAVRESAKKHTAGK